MQKGLFVLDFAISGRYLRISGYFGVLYDVASRADSLFLIEYKKKTNHLIDLHHNSFPSGLNIIPILHF